MMARHFPLNAKAAAGTNRDGLNLIPTPSSIPWRDQDDPYVYQSRADRKAH
jgi:hypothetical protein